MSKATILATISLIFLFTGDYVGEEKQRKRKPIMETIQPEIAEVIGLYGGDRRVFEDKYIIIRTPKPNRAFYIVSIDSFVNKIVTQNLK